MASPRKAILAGFMRSNAKIEPHISAQPHGKPLSIEDRRMTGSFE
jgi:hypothetical protein